jgi:predicted secreted hydrolase
MRRWLAMAACALVQACDPPPEPAAEGDFAVLAQGAGGFEQARPGMALEFPRDHGAHPGFRIEWWYLTANLQGPDGHPYGAQWTLFRTANASSQVQPISQSPGNPWQDPQVFMAHLAITMPGGHVSFQRYARGGDYGGIARAGVGAAPFAAWLDDWSLRSSGDGWLPLRLDARQGRHAVRLRLSSERPLVLQGLEGFSEKHPEGGGSYYYSQPFLAAAGELEVDGRVVPVTGKAWLDREWSSQFLQPDQAGWDWFALHLDSGEKLMLFRLRAREGTGVEDYRHGVLIGLDGDKQVLDPQRIELQVLQHSRVAGRELPLNWLISLPQVERAFKVEALHPEQWMDVDFAYWEGVVRVSGEGPGNQGVGYLELTGYARE